MLPCRYGGLQPCRNIGICNRHFAIFPIPTRMPAFAALKEWARRIKRDAVMLWFARRHPQTPFLAKALCVFTVAYALSPIDLIPDFIPVLGYVDEILLLPAMIWLAVKMLPEQVIRHCRQQAQEWMAQQHGKPKSYAGAVIIVAIWIAILVLLWNWWR